MKEEKLSFRIIGCAMRVHTELGPGYQEKIYHRALEIEFRHSGIPFESEKEMDIYYRNEPVGNRRADFFLHERVMLEIKAIREISDADMIQLNNYTKMVNMPFGLLINFGGPSLQYKKVFNLEHPINIKWRANNQQRLLAG
jgi:GxxExxY protein